MKRKQDPTPSPGGEDPRRVAPEDIQAKEFRMARLGGYKERDVDEFLDELTEAWTALLEENRRLLTQAGGRPGIGGPELVDATRRAENIIRRSHEEAAQVLREAETRAGA